MARHCRWSTPTGARVSSLPTKPAAKMGCPNLNAPLSSLVGVFLSDAQPNTLPAPAALDFAVGSGINFLTLSPLLQQVFFIGDGLTDTSIRQQFLVPLGATRLYLGTMDGYEWNNNSGSLSATVTTVTVTPRDIEAPEPATLIPLGIGLAVMIGLRARR